MLLVANILQPLIDGVEAIIKFFQSDVGLSWGLAIVALTFTVRLALLPLSLRGIRSMRRMQIIAPQLKALQEKYKDDRERMQRELMKLYQENGINPFSSCLPLIIQFPFFIAIYQLLRGQSFADDVEASGANQGFLFVQSVIEKPQGAETVILIVLFIVTTTLTFLYTMSTTQTTSGAQRYIFLALPVFIAPFIVSAPAGLAVYWITTNIWSLGQQVLVQRIMPAPTPPTPEQVEKTKAPPPPPPRKRKRRRR
jgi:YidC/Oxa1 family membrane protein insertase